MELFDYYRSTASYRVRIALNLKNITYTLSPIHLLKEGGEQHSMAYRKLNPQALVPTLNENGHLLSQSLAIIEYLDEICPTPSLLPITPLGRAQVRSLALLICCDIHPINNLRVLNYCRQSFSADPQQIQEWYHHWLKQGFDALEIQLEKLPRKHTVCYGLQVTLADLCLIPQVYNANRFNFSLTNYPLIQEINDYCLTLPAFQAAAPEEN